MGQKIRLWEVTRDKSISEIQSDGISLEEQMEDWLASDIAMLDPDLLVIGRQVWTGFGSIDLLCIDAGGALVVVELKRGRTPRQVTAQALEYASWVQDLNAADIEAIRGKAIADGYLTEGAGSLKEAFEAKFEEDLPEVLNESHRSVVVAESIDDSTGRVVRYLANLGVPVNVATVQCFKDQTGRQLLAQVYLVEPEFAESKARGSSKRSRGDKLKQQQALADEHDIGPLFAKVRNGVAGVLRASGASDHVRYVRQLAQGGQRTVLKVWSDRRDDAGMRFLVHVDRFDEHLGMSREQLELALPENSQESHDVRKWVGATPKEREGAVGIAGDFRTDEEVDAFCRALQELAD